MLHGQHGNWWGGQSHPHHHHHLHHHRHALLAFSLWSPLGLWGSPFYWNSALYRPWGYNPYYYGYSGYGYPWYRYGWRTSGYYPVYQSVCSGNPAYYAANYAYQPDLPVTAGPTATTTEVAVTTPEAAVAATAAEPNDAKTDDEAKRDSEAFAQQGELKFKSGQYADAAYAFRHALVDDPNNGVLMLLLAQSLFAEGKFSEAAGALQVGMLMMPTDQWGVVVENYTELYNDNQKFTDQLRALEKARKEKTEEPGLRFLLGYQYGYLGYPSNAVKELNKAVELAPQDELAAKLREAMQAKLSPKEPVAPAETASEPSTPTTPEPPQ